MTLQRLEDHGGFEGCLRDFRSDAGHLGAPVFDDHILQILKVNPKCDAHFAPVRPFRKNGKQRPPRSHRRSSGP